MIDRLANANRSLPSVLGPCVADRLPLEIGDSSARHPGFLAKMAMCCGRGRYAGIVRPPAWQRYQSAVSLDVTDQQKREASALRRRSVPTGIALARKSSLLECGAEGRG